MPLVKTLAKGQIVIPADLRKKYHIEPGKELHLMEYGGSGCANLKLTR